MQHQLSDLSQTKLMLLAEINDSIARLEDRSHTLTPLIFTGAGIVLASYFSIFQVMSHNSIIASLIIVLLWLFFGTLHRIVALYDQDMKREVFCLEDLRLRILEQDDPSVCTDLYLAFWGAHRSQYAHFPNGLTRLARRYGLSIFPLMPTLRKRREEFETVKIALESPQQKWAVRYRDLIRSKQ